MTVTSFFSLLIFRISTFRSTERKTKELGQETENKINCHSMKKTEYTHHLNPEHIKESYK